MRFLPLLPAVLAVAPSLVSTSPIHPGDAGTEIRPVYEFPNGTWVENLAPRSNGKLLVTLINIPELWEIDPFTGEAELVYSFPNATAATGIAEIDQDVFAINVGNVSAPQGVLGSWSVWTVDYNAAEYSKEDHHQSPDTPKVERLTSVPTAVFMNGLTTLSEGSDIFLAGDSALGVVFAINSRTGAHHITIDDPALKPNSSATFHFGVNGIQARNSTLYFINSSGSPLLGRIPLKSDGSAAGPVETIASRATFGVNDGFWGDDFTIDKEGRNAWIATNPSNSVVKVDLVSGGAQTVVVGGVTDPVVAGCTSTAFGRTKFDRSTLYIVTDGGLADPSSAGQRGGAVLALDTQALHTASHSGHW